MMNFWSYLREEDMGKPFSKEELTGASVEFTKSRHIQFTLTDGRIVTLGTGEDNYNFGEIEFIPRKQSLWGKKDSGGGFAALSSTPEDGYELLSKGDDDDLVFVKPFYLKTENGKVIFPYQRSDVPQTGYTLHPAFVKQSVGGGGIYNGCLLQNHSGRVERVLRRFVWVKRIWGSYV